MCMMRLLDSSIVVRFDGEVEFTTSSFSEENISHFKACRKILKKGNVVAGKLSMHIHPQSTFENFLNTSL